MKKSYKVLDLFAGGGGFSTGFSLAETSKSKFEIKRAVEIDENACQTLQLHLGKRKVLSGDITDKSFKEKIINECSDVDVIIGGPPCQTFSLAGPARSGKKEIRQVLKDDPRNTLYKHFFEIVEKINPKIVVFENVEGILSKKNDETGLNDDDKVVIEAVSDELESLGFNCSLRDGRKYQVLTGTEFGVPQQRRRVIIIANKLGKESPIANDVVKLDKVRTVKDTIFDLPVLLPIINVSQIEKLKNMDVVIRRFEESLDIFVQHINFIASYYKERPEMNSEQFRMLLNYLNINLDRVKKRKNYKNKALKEFLIGYNDLVKGLDRSSNVPSKFTEHKSRRHNFRDILILILMEQGSNSAQFMNPNSNYYSEFLSELYPYDKSKHKDTYVKHSWDKPSNTILAHMEKDGLKFIHPIQPRTYTPYEAALIQTFPNQYEFCGGRNAQYRQIGNAVPPVMAKYIGVSILKLFEKVVEERIERELVI